MALLFVGVLGLLSIVNTFNAIIRWILVTFLCLAKTLSKYGSWAMVIGPTDGIGRAFTFQLARHKMNLVLVGRKPSKVQDLTDELQSKYKSQVKNIVVDFSQDLVEGMNRVEEVINGLNVGIVINNVGLSYPYARFFHEVDSQLLKNLIAVNTEGTTRMIQNVLPGMLQRKKRAIINLGSGAATIIPLDPLYSVYSTTKVYVDKLSRSLYMECKQSGIDVRCQVPLYIATKMASIKKSSFLIPSTDTYARSTLQWVGYESQCTHYWPYSVIWRLESVLLEPLVDAYHLKYSISICKRSQPKAVVTAGL